MRTWFISLMLVGLLVLLSFNVWFFYSYSTAGESNASQSEPVHLKLLANQSWINRPFLQKAIENYEKTTGIQIDIQAVPSNSADSIIKKKFSVNVLADIVLFNGGAQLEALHPTNNFVNMNDEAWVNDLEPFVNSQITNNFNVYGFPLWEGAISGVIYNKNLFEKYNLQVPQTMEQFFQVCEVLKSHDINPLYMGFRDIWPIYPEFGIDSMAASHADMVKSLNRNQLKLTEIPEMLQLTRWYDRLAKQGYLGKGFATNNWDGQAEALASGKYAMALGTDTYLYTELESKHPGTAVNYGIMPTFFGFKDDGNYTRNDLIAMYVNKKSRYVTEALDFVRSTATAKQLNDVYRDVYMQPLFKSIKTNKWTPQFLEVQQTKAIANIVPVAANLMIGFSSVEMAVPIQEMMLGEISPEIAVKRMEAIRFTNAQNQGTPGF